MKFVNKLNLEKYFNGFFPKGASANPKLQEISACLRARMQEESMVKNGLVYAPDSYEIHINQKDYRKLKAALKNNSNAYFENLLTKEAQIRGYNFIGDLQVKVVPGKMAQGAGVKILSVFADEKITFPQTGEKQLPGNSDETKIFEKLDITLPIPVKPLAAAATIAVVDGFDLGRKIEFSDARINLGRRPSNELALNDKSASRLHAYIVRENGSHVIYDAQSLNGTYVNDELIEKKNLADGDKIKIGDTIISYKLN